MIVIDLSPNKLLEMAVDWAAPPKIDAVEFVGDETLAANAPNEADPKRPLFAGNCEALINISRFFFAKKKQIGGLTV